MLRATAAGSLVALAAGHGMINYPPSRNMRKANQSYAGQCAGGGCLWFNQGCGIGCSACNGQVYPNVPGCMAQTLPSKFITYPSGYTTITSNPWRAPGHAPIGSPCGIAGGWWTASVPGTDDVPPVGYKQGTDGKDIPQLDWVTNEWKAGSNQEVSWDIFANHGGGYQYRLCPMSTFGWPEDCFQATPLRFHGDTQWIQFGGDRANRTAIPAMTVSTGTKPAGSQWRRNPIPACSGPMGGSNNLPCNGPQFAPPIPGLYGFGLSTCSGAGGRCSDAKYNRIKAQFNFNVVDMLEIPASLPKGEYVMSFRWDCEQTPQIWAGCADIKIV